MLVLLAILIFIYNFGATFLMLSGSEISPAGKLLYAAALPCGAIWWLRSDARRSVINSLYCQGMLVGYGWLVTLPYHLLKTRGAKGFLPLLLLIGSYVSAPIAAGIAYLLLFGPPGSTT